MTHSHIDAIAADTTAHGQEFTGHYSSSSAVAALAISNLHLDSVAWAGIGNTVVMDVGGNATVDGGPADWATGSLTVERSGAAVSTDVLGFNTAGALFTVSGNELQAGGLAFATFDLTGGKLTVSFSSSATQASVALVQDVLQHVTYRSDTPGGNATLHTTLSHGVETATADVTVTSNTIYVTTASDTATIDPSDGVSLTEALAIAAMAGGSNTIAFASNLAGSTITLAADATVATGTIFEMAGTGTITIADKKLTFADLFKASVGSGARLVVQSEVSGSIEKTGLGTLELNRGFEITTNTTGTVLVSGGVLALNGTNNNISDTSAVTVATGASMSLIGGSETIGSLAGAGNVSLGYRLNIGDNNTSTTFSGVITSIVNNGIVKTGTGTLTLSGANTYLGSTTVQGGTLDLANAGSTISLSNSVTVNNGATLKLSASNAIGSLAGTGTVNLGAFDLTAGNSNGTTSFSGALTGSGQLAKTGTGNFTLSGSNSGVFAGTIGVNNGTLSVSSDDNLGTGTVTVNNGATLALTGNGTIDNAIAVSGSATIQVATGINARLEGALTGAGSTLAKTGAGTLTLSSNGSSVGATTVSSGTLVVDGTLANTSSVSVNPGATLAGSGTVATGGAVNVASGGTLSPGNGGAGKLTINGNLALASGATLAVDINGTTAGTQYDQVAVTGTVSVNGATLSATHGYTPGMGDFYRLIDNDVADGITGTFAGLAESASLTAAGNGTSLKGSYLGGTGNDFTLIAPAAPTVTSIVREGGAAQITNATTLKYTVTFSQAVSGVDASDFTVPVGSAGTVDTVTDTGTGTTYTVTVNNATAEGSTRIDLKTSGTNIVATVGNAAITGGYTAGEFYTLDHVAPTTTVDSIVFGTDTGGSGTDLITSAEGQLISGTLGSGNEVFDKVQVSVNNGTSWTDVTVAEGATTWSLSNHALVSGNNTIKVRVTDRAGNHGPELSRSYVWDSTAPILASASVNGSALTLRYTDTVQLDTVNKAATSAFAVTVAGAPAAVNSVAVDAVAKTVTLTLASAAQPGQAVTVAYTAPTGGNDANATQDMAGNDAASFAAMAATNDIAAPDSGTSTPPPATVDGVPITTASSTNGAIIITVPVVPSTRPDTAGSPNPTLADIPLAKDASGQSLLQVGVPTGMGLTAEGLPTAATGAAALAELTQRIERVAGAGSELGPQGQAFLATLGANEPLTVQSIKPTVGTGFNPAVPLVITGGSGKQAVVIDATGLPSGTVIQVDNVEFVAIVGAVRVIGGAGQNVASGDGAAQWIVLGPDDDVIYGGGGNDVVGSEGGDDQVFGDAGDDIVFGGAGNDILSGGTGSDRLNGGTGFDVAIQEGARSDYTVTLDGAGIKLTHTASGVSDWLVDVEQVRFATGPGLTVAHSAAEEAAAYLFQKWIGRDLNQGEGSVIQSLTGKTALEVANLFAQVFPEQSAGKTPAQLLEGMAAAGAIRVDAVRDVIVNGDAGNNSITPILGLARYMDGGAGIDTVILSATLAQTHVQTTANGFTLQRMTDGAMLDVTHVERVTLSDTKLALDLNGNAGEAAKLLGALGGPAALANKGLVGEVMHALDAGATSQALAGIGLQALGAQTPAQVAQLLWTNAMGRAGTQAEIKPLVDLMASGVSFNDVAVMAAHLDATAVRIDLVGLAAKGLEFA